MKHIKRIDEGWYGSNPHDYDYPESQRYIEMKDSELKFRCVNIGEDDALLVKKGVPNELWVLKIWRVEDLDEFKEHMLRYQTSEDDYEYEEIDEEAIEGFATWLYSGGYIGKDSSYKNSFRFNTYTKKLVPREPPLPLLYKKEAVREDPDDAFGSYDHEFALLIRVSGALATHLKEKYLEEMGETPSNVIRAKLRDAINLLSKVYPEGRTLPGEYVEEPEEE